MDILEEHVLFNGNMDKKPASSLRFPVPNCKPYYYQWLLCVDTKDNCCGANKCRFHFTEWQNCHKYSDEVRAVNARIPRYKDAGTYNGLSAK
jgi:hypothetical protein